MLDCILVRSCTISCLCFLWTSLYLTLPLYAQEAIQPVDTRTLHNVWKLSPRILSGSEPEDESAFAELARLGVKTIVSVDGIAPRIALAKKYGMRYVHVPIGYDGIDTKAQGSLSRVASDIKGLIYIHCHHGKHRGPAAAAIVCRADDGRSADDALTVLEKAGTGKEYPGLWRDVAQFKKPSGPLPALTEHAEVESLAAAMARIDRTFDRLKLSSKGKWKPLPEHPDVVPNIEAVQLLELFTEASRAATGDLKTGLQETVSTVSNLQTAISRSQFVEADKLLSTISTACSACHKQHRN